MKASQRPLVETENEFLNILRSIKLNDKIFTCSHSLELLIQKYRYYVENQEENEKRIAELEKENFDLKNELTEKQAVTSYLQEQTKF
jgi:cell shape-determining protein MreC